MFSQLGGVSIMWGGGLPPLKRIGGVRQRMNAGNKRYKTHIATWVKITTTRLENSFLIDSVILIENMYKTTI